MVGAAALARCRMAFERHVVSGEVFEGQIDATALGVFGYVAEDVGELEGDAGFLGEFFCGRIGVAEDADADEADDRRDEIAVLIEVGEGRVGVGSVAGIGFEIGRGAGNEFVEKAERDVEALRGIADGDEDRIVVLRRFARRCAMRPATARDCERRCSREMLSSSERSSALRMKA